MNVRSVPQVNPLFETLDDSRWTPVVLRASWFIESQLFCWNLIPLEGKYHYAPIEHYEL